MKYALLDSKDWPQLEPIFKENGSTLPAIATISAATNGDGIAAFQCLQPILHVEPIWIHPAYSGKIQFRDLLEPLKKTLPKGTEFYAFAPDELVERICGHLQMTKLPWTVWKGVI